MAHRNKVARSIESPCATRCVDIFHWPDGGFGYAEFRRDPEDPHGWRPGHPGPETVFATEAQALAAARAWIGWLGPALDEMT